jgi:hypothetical protein
MERYLNKICTFNFCFVEVRGLLSQSLPPPLKSDTVLYVKSGNTDNNYVAFSRICSVVYTKHLFGPATLLFLQFSSKLR